MVEINTADIQLFILELHDDTRWPSKYYKDVIRYAIAHAKDPTAKPPKSIDYASCCREYSRPSGEKAIE